MFKLQTGTDILYVPYQGAAPAITDLIAGRMHMIIDAQGRHWHDAGRGERKRLTV